MSHQWPTTEGVFGVPLSVSSGFIFLFVLFGPLLGRAGQGGGRVVGCRPDQAGAVEVSRSVNGQIMPPFEMHPAAILLGLVVMLQPGRKRREARRAVQ